jgi:hypothetical protein
MDRNIAKEVINAIRSERQRRSDRLQDEDAEAAYEQWLFTDEPFINEMCLMVLVALRHQVERELAMIAGRTSAEPTMTIKQYQQNVRSQRERLLKQSGWACLVATLNLKSFPEWGKSMETLRLLANCLKHEPWQEPDEKLLKHLKLPTAAELKRPVVGYMPLPESRCFREGLAASLDLPRDADYCAITEKFVDLVGRFLEDVKRNTRLGQLTGPASMVEFGC